MLERLRELVFGLGEYEKTRLDVRFEFIFDITNKLEINQLKDFEILEEVIYKIKDQLRVKSSNLNRYINEPSKNIKKSEILNLLERLNSIKYDFLEKAFRAIDDKRVEEFEKNEAEVENNLEDKNYNDQISRLNIFQNNHSSIYLENGKVPYLLVSFDGDIDFVFLKQLSTIVYDSFKAEATNILVENKRALIIPRILNDNLFDLQRIELNLDDVYDEIMQKNEKSINKEKKSDGEDKENNTYVEISKDAKKRVDTDSLDSIIGKEYDEGIVHPRPAKDRSDIKILEDDPIVIEKSEKKKNDDLEFEIEREGMGNQESQKISPEKQLEEQIIEKKEVDFQKEEEKSISPQVPKNKYEIYRDDQVVAYLNEDSKVLGELIIKHISGMNIKDIEEHEFTYMTIFSKVFSAYIFDIMQAHGTNMVMDYNKDKISIVPRYKDDGLNLRWNPIQESDDSLEEIKEKLIDRMHNELNGSVEEEKKLIKEEKKPELSDTEKKEKAKFLLDSLMRRIP